MFLLTSSTSDFACDLTEHILGADWMDYFDITLQYARKPGFFKTQDPSERPFFKFDDVEKTKEVTELQTGQCYIEGNAQTFYEYLQKATGKQQPKVLYFGDSMRSDIHPSSVHVNWQSVFVLEEMEVEELIPNEPAVGMPTDQSDGPNTRTVR